MKQPYRIVDREATVNPHHLAEFLAKDGQLLLPFLDFLDHAQGAVDEVVDVVGRAGIEALLLMSAEQVAGPKQRGKRDESRKVHWFGSQPGRVALSDRQLKVRKPRLRRKTKKAGRSGEVAIPAYEAMHKDDRLGDRMLEILMTGVSTRQYSRVLTDMADQVGVSKSQVSRETIDAGERRLKELAERDFSELDILVVYVDGLVFGDHHVVGAIGVDTQGKKHLLGLREGASENTAVVTALLGDLVERGVRPNRRRLFVIDGAKALRKAIDQVYGCENEVQRCRNHKRRNVLSHLPKDQHAQARSVLAAAWKLEPKEGKAKIEQYASWLEAEWPSAAESLREGLDELFTVKRLNLSPALCRCLANTNLIDSMHSGVRTRTRRVTRWKSGQMALRWAAAAFVETEKTFRRILGYRDLWMLKAHLDEHRDYQAIAEKRRAG
jgi:transposase-like protein